VRNDNFSSIIVQRLKRWREEYAFSRPAGLISGVLGVTIQGLANMLQGGHVSVAPSVPLEALRGSHGSRRGPGQKSMSI
jgi:hypothetical protein